MHRLTEKKCEKIWRLQKFLYRFSGEQLSFTTPLTFQGAASSVLTGFSPHFLHMESILTIFAEKF